MSNTLLTPTVILREAGRLFHEKAKFIRSIDRQYDDRFAKSGAKVGSTIALRDRNEFTIRTGATISLQDVSETSQNLTVGTQKGVDFGFGAADLTLTIDDFSERYISPAVARIVANVESDCISQARNAVANCVDGGTNAFAFTYVAQAKQKLDEHLAPEDDQRSLLLCPTHSTKYLVDTKGLFTPQGKLGAQYGDGMVKDALGFNIMMSNKLTAHATGTAVASSGYLANQVADQTGASIIVDTGSTTFLKGDIVTFGTINTSDAVYEVDPETKTSLGYLKQFVITADSGASATTLAIDPPVQVTGGKQNVSQGVKNNAPVTKVGGGASANMVESLAYHKDAFVFASVDLEDPSRYGQWGAVENMDSLSMRIWRSADIVNDQFPCRIDVFYGFLARYPKVACRINATG